jgi:hypothetical protein
VQQAAAAQQPVRYTLPKPLPTGQTELTLAPFELIDRRAAIGITMPACSPRTRTGAPASPPAPGNR